MVVAVTRTGNVFFVGDKVALEQLDVKIQQRLTLGSEKAIRSSGVERVGFLVDQRKQLSLP